MSAPSEVDLIFDDQGIIHTLWHECIPLHLLGKLSIQRASHIEFNRHEQMWEVLSPDKEHVIHADVSRDACLDWERENLVVPT